MQQQQAPWQVRRLCQLLEVSRRGSYAWLRRPPRAQAPVAQEVQDNIQRSVAQGRGTYGTRRLQHRLAQDGLQVSRRRLGRFLAQAGLRGKTRRTCKAPKTSGPAPTVAPHHRTRACTVHAPEKVDVGDIPSLPTGEGGWSLAGVLDRCARAVVGGSMANPRRAERVTQALAMAIGQRQPAAGFIMPTDRGSPYGAESARQLLTQHGMQPRRSRKGTGWDNAVAERFFHTLKTAWISLEAVATHAQAQTGVFAYIAVFSHRQRCHAAHGSLAPLAYEQVLKASGTLCPEMC